MTHELHDYLNTADSLTGFGTGIAPLTTYGINPMTWEQIENSGLRGLPLLQKIIESLRKFPIPVKFAIQDELAYGGFTLYIKYQVVDAYTGQQGFWQNFHTTFQGSPNLPEISAKQWAAWLCHIISFIAVHEVAEFFVVGGERLFDPHDETRALRNISHLLMPWDF